jgi:hypothetical protein
MAAPTFKIGDVVYLVESAALGELEAYKIGGLSQATPGIWVYQIYIEQKPPTEQTVGDRVDLKEPREMFYEETEIFTLCEAVQTAINNLTIRINRTQFQIDECLGQVETTYIDPIPVPQPNPGPNEPRYNINDTVFIKNSANVGFLEAYKVTTINKQPNSREFIYDLDLTTEKLAPQVTQGGKPRFKMDIFFKERELITKCEAVTLIMAALQRKISRLLALKAVHCMGSA